VYPRDHGAVESGTPSGAGRWASSPPRGLYPLRVPPGEGAVKIFSSYAKQKKKKKKRLGWVGVGWVGVGGGGVWGGGGGGGGGCWLVHQTDDRYLWC